MNALLLFRQMENFICIFILLFYDIGASLSSDVSFTINKYTSIHCQILKCLRTLFELTANSTTYWSIKSQNKRRDDISFKMVRSQLAYCAETRKLPFISIHVILNFPETLKLLKHTDCRISGISSLYYLSGKLRVQTSYVSK